MNPQSTLHPAKKQHRSWVKACHWIVSLSFLVLVFSGFEILMVHPRLYWGEVGNELTHAILEFPISRNYQRDSWEKSVPFFETKGSPVSAARTFDEEMFNENSWGRSLHFFAAWFLVAAGLVYLLIGIVSGHFIHHIWPKRKELFSHLFWQDLMDHLRMRIPPASGGPQYGLLQKLAYMVVLFVALPLIVITGLSMSPAITAAYPFLLKIFGGFQSTRTIHFFTSVALELFLFVHLMMIIKSGFKQQIRYMTYGKSEKK